MTEQELKKLEDKLWAAADKMRGAVSVSDYKFIVLGLIFLKYISDSFEEKYKELVEEGAGLEEERDCYTAENIFYVPKNARWEYLVEHSKDTNIGEIIDDALTLIEKENTSLKNVLPKNYNSPTMRNVNLGELLDLFTNIKVGTKEAKEKDLLGRIYEYFLGQFAKNELQKGGEFYTPACLVRTMVECIEPFKGKVYDPACGSGGMFVQSMKFVEENQGSMYDVGIFGQEKNPTTWRLAKMNLAIRSMYGDLGKYAADTFTEDLHKDLKADFILANPPFNLEWDRDKVENDPRWKYGLAPKNNANFAWLQHMISKLSQNGKMACILAKGSLDVGYEEGKIREKIVEADLVDCIIVMPSNLFYTVTIPCAIWIINRNKKRKGQTLFINASKMGTLVNRKLRELSKEEISEIANIYHCYQNDLDYKDIEGICKIANIEDIRKKNYNLLPGKYIDNGNTSESNEDFENKYNNIISYLDKTMNDSLIKEKKLIHDLKRIKVKESSELPEGWTTSNLTEIAKYLNGLPMQKHRPKEKEESLPVLKIKELRQRMCDEDSELCSANIDKDYIIKDGDVVFSWSGSLLVDIWSDEDCGLNQHLFKVTSDNFDKWFYYSWTAYHLKEFAKIASDKATTMGHIKRGDLENAEVLIPSKEDYSKMKEIMEPLLDLMIQRRKETRRLEELCSSIIPKILTGELDCSNIDLEDKNE